MSGELIEIDLKLEDEWTNGITLMRKEETTTTSPTLFLRIIRHTYFSQPPTPRKSCERRPTSDNELLGSFGL